MQELLLKPTAQSSSASNAFIGLMGGTDSGADAEARAAAGSKFRSLLQLFADTKSALKSLGQPDAVAQPAQDGAKLLHLQADALLADNGDVVSVGMKPVCVLNYDPEACSHNPEELPADVMAQLTALMQQFPHLREVFANKADLQAVVDAIDYLQMTKTPDLTKFNLPEDVKEFLLKLSHDQAALANVSNLIDKISQQPQILEAIKAGFVQDKEHAVKTELEAVVDETAKVKNPDVKFAAHDAQPEAAGQKKALNVLAEDRLVVDATQKPLKSDTIKLMSETTISAADAATKADIVNAAAEVNPELSFDEAMQHALHAADTLQAGKHSIMSAAGLEAYSARGVGSVPAHIASMQVAIQLQRNLQAGRTNAFLIQLQPEELGRIEVTLKFEGSRVRALIAAEKEETLDLLKHDAKVLDKALQGAGLETDAGSLEFSLGQNFDKSNEAKKNHANDRAFGTMIADTELDTGIKQDLSAAHIMMMATGRVDVKL